jgi:hypothetical protein
MVTVNTYKFQLRQTSDNDVNTFFIFFFFTDNSKLILIIFYFLFKKTTDGVTVWKRQKYNSNCRYSMLLLLFIGKSPTGW